MTTYQSFMLSTCFGVATGIVIAGWFFIIKDWIEKIKEKCRKRKDAQKTEAETTIEE
ncbi:MAG: hypothetical protein LKJ83_03140 [Eubacteriaceae bacterium]|nr:hypothetical protein [Eubacteriaceae bacterium]